MRAFVAVDVPPLAEGAERRGSAPPHVTLRFLGEIPAAALPQIVRRLGLVAAASAPFDLGLAGVGAFPTRRDPRVVWVGASDGAAELTALAAEVRRALAEFGTPERDDTFVPHVTWFRVRSPADRRAALDVLEGRRPAPPPRRGRVEELLLKESVLGAGGAVHRTVAAFRLGAAATGDPAVTSPLPRS
jgi:RNA 2',3'-cyclic 3'-phosphodiesterase